MALKRITEVTIISSSDVTETPHTFIEHDGAFYRIDSENFQKAFLGGVFRDLEAIIAEDFSTSSTYDVGDLAIYDNKLYECTTAIATAGSWDSTKWTELDLATKITTDKSLALRNRPADAKTVGDAIASIALTVVDPNNDGHLELVPLADEWSDEFLEDSVVEATENWLEEHVSSGNIVVDNTLSISGAAADSKVTGDNITELKEDLTDIEDEVINVSGSWTKNYAHNFTPSDQILLSVESSTSDRLVAFSGIADMDDTATVTHIFTLAPGKKMLWIPDKDYEGIQVAVNGSCVASATILGALTSVTNVFYCGASRELKTIKAAVEKATEQMNSVLYVDAGTYDLIDEFGSDYFEGLTSNDTMSGIKLKNRIHVIFAPNSKVICHYTGNNQYAQSLFSPFVVDQFGFTLENLTIECSRVRYAVHDERNGGTEYCESNYINCFMSIDNTQNQYFGSNAPAVIGGGLGANHVVNIESCIFDSNKGGAYSAGVYYHQSNKLTNPNHKCFLSIKNNYFKRGLLSLQFDRTDATEDTNIIVEGNNFPMVTGQDSQGIWSSSMTGNHVNLFAWNNVIRSV